MDELSSNITWMTVNGVMQAVMGALVAGFGVHLWRRLRALGRMAVFDRGKTAAILEAAVDGVITIDDAGRIDSFNRAAERLFGYRAAEVIGRNISMLMPEPYRSHHDKYLAAYLASGQAQVIGVGREVIGLRKDGTTFPMDLSVGESRMGNRRLFAGIVRDITARKQAEQDLRDGEARNRAVLETAVDGIMTIDAVGVILSANPAAERIFGYRADQMVGQPVTMLMPEPHRSQHPQYLTRYQQTGERKIIGIGREVQGQRRDGSVFPMELSVGEAVVAGVKVFTGIVRDITARKQAEEQLRAAKEQAELASLSQSKFFAAASQDLRQPVQAITLFTAALESKLAGAPACALIDDIKGSLGSLNTLLDAMLDVSRLDSGTVVPHEVTFSLATVLERLAEEFAPLAEQKEIALRFLPCSATVRTDPTLLYRMLHHFLSNAIRYTSQGRIVVGCRRRGKKLRVQVVDSGIGIAERHMGQIFTEFFQVGNPERDRAKGLGLGLAIVDRLSRLLRCPVSVKSKPGHGSIFAVDVNVVGFNKATNIIPLHAPALEPPRSGKALIFVIDDEPTVLKSLRMALEGWGYTVLSARTALETVTLLSGRQQAPDLVIADYGLRGICNGAQVVEQVRDLFKNPIPGIIMNGDTNPEVIRQAYEHGLKLLHKPVSPSDLHAAIVHCLGEGRNASGSDAS